VSKGKNNILISILLLIFVGQVAASNVIPCPSDANGQSDSIHSLMMDHSMSNMADMDDTSSSAMKDCCAENNDCSMSGCLTMASPSLLANMELAFTFQNIVNTVNTAIVQSPTSLYRPPILI